jgi:hypothetical protein
MPHYVLKFSNSHRAQEAWDQCRAQKGTSPIWPIVVRADNAVQVALHFPHADIAETGMFPNVYDYDCTR